MKFYIPLLFVGCILLLSDTAYAQTEFETFCAQYGNINTLAGKGKVREKSENGWKMDYEAGPAKKAELSRPHFAMADEAGNTYIADKDAHAIRMVDASGRISTIAGTSKSGFNGDGIATDCMLRYPNGLFVEPDGTYYILDMGNNRVCKVDREGMLTTVFIDKEGIRIGRGLWVTDNGATIYYASGKRVRMWTAASGCEDFCSGFGQLGNITLDHEGQLVVTDRGANIVYRVPSKGKKIAIAGNGDKKGIENGEKATDVALNGVRAIWFLENGAYLLGTHEGGKVFYVSTDGKIYRLVHGGHDHEHDGDGNHFKAKGKKVSEVRSVTVAPNGTIIITENDHGYIRIIKRVP